MIKEGMYVEFTEIDSEANKVKKVGQWISEVGDHSKIFSHEWRGNKLLSHPGLHFTGFIKRAEIKDGVEGIVNGNRVTIVRRSKKKDSDGYRLYYCFSSANNRSYLISEKNIKVSSDSLKLKPQDLFCEGSFCNPMDYIRRYNIKKYVTSTDSVSKEYEGVIGKRIELLEHQIETVKTVVDKMPFRAILADEVGLGKTIEALVILDYALRNGCCKKALIIVPEQLRYQWTYEATSKFNLDAGVFMFHEFFKRIYTHKVCVISDVDFIRYLHDFNWSQWDFVICDEVHRAVRDEQLYAGLLKMSKLAKHLLLLSATPLLQRNEEMFRLLKLYNPEYYSELGYEGFKRVVNVRKAIIERIETVSYGFKMKPDLDHARKCLYTFRDIANDFNDISLRNYISRINENDEEDAVNSVRIIFSYLDEKYEIKPKYIRHRRADILDESSKRCLYKEIPFFLDSFKRYGEEIIYQSLREELDVCVRMNEVSVDEILLLGNAFFSSSAAMNRVLIDKELYTRLPNTYRLNHQRFLEEEKELSNSRIETLIAYLKNNKEFLLKKTVIFTEYSETAALLQKRISKEFGKESVTLFAATVGTGKMGCAHNSFKNLSSCKFMICDKSGAEGKNLQFADYIIHYDTPWIPTDLEQRIGRLDRIGRGSNRPVRNIVVYSRDSIEEDLVAMCKEDLNIYEESLSGIEIVFDQITALIKSSIKENVLLGFDIVGDEIRALKETCEEAVQMEAFEQMCVQAENGYIDKIHEVISDLTGSKYSIFVDSLCKYHCQNGYKVVENGNEIYLEGIPGKLESITGTFEIEEALKEDKLNFLSLSNSLIRHICNQAIDNDFNTSTAIRVPNAGFEWCGFIACWEFQHYLREYCRGIWEDIYEKLPYMYVREPLMLLAKGYDSEDFSVDYLMEELIKALEGNRYNVLNISQVEEELDVSNIEMEINTILHDMYKTYKELFAYRIDFNQLKADIETKRQEIEINKLLKQNHRNEQGLTDLLLATKQALNKTSGKLDSIFFVRFEK